MSAGPGDAPSSRMRCRGCDADVPAGRFCGLCGCDQSGSGGERLRWLRPGTFAAAPHERVLRPIVTSALFPRLSSAARRPFRMTMVGGAAALVLLALLSLQCAGITVAALGLPVLFVLYLRVCGAGQTVHRRALILAAGLGAGLGIVWVLGTDQWLIQSFSIPEGSLLPHVFGRLVRFVVVLFLMVLPAVVVRLGWKSARDSLEGYSIGVLGALAFTAAATLTRLAPQFTTSLISARRPVEGLVVQAVLSGVTVPITAAAAAGMTGILLFFRRPAPNAGRDHPGRVRWILIVLVASALLVQAALVAVDIAGLTDTWMLLPAHVVAAAVALIALRVGLQLAMLHEAHDPGDEINTLPCQQCGQSMPDMPFCAGCGADSWASARDPRRPGANRVPVGWLSIIATLAVLFSALGVALTPKVSTYMCPPDCGRPVSGLPFARNPFFTAANGDFSVAYPAAGTIYRVTTEPNGVTAFWTSGDGGTMHLFSEPANGRSPRDIARSVIRKERPGAVFAYEIPNAMVGYQLGYGEVDDYWPTSSTARNNRERILVMAAVKNDLALIASAIGPFHEFGPDFGPGHPSAASLEIAQDLSQYVNSFTWRGDPPR